MKSYAAVKLAGVSLLALNALTSCIHTHSSLRHADVIAQQGNLTRFEINAGRHILTGWQRLAQYRAPSIRIYIEGDGRAWISKSQASPDPTPTYPLALMLAAQDNTPSVIYLGRPCQYTDLKRADNDCRRADWTTARYSPEVIDNYMYVLDRIKIMYGVEGFELVGYSGGANIAGLLAARRVDISAIRTVAGNIDNEAFTNLHGVSAMPNSLNMADYAEELAHIPQIHFVGAKDDIVQESVGESYQTKMGKGCSQIQMIAGADHKHGWDKAWPDLLKATLPCR